MTAAILTVGCRLNQAESDCLRGGLIAQGIKVLSGECRIPIEVVDVIYINTCTVTSNADRTSLMLVREASRLSPKPYLIVLGCLAERAGTQIAAIPGVDEVWCNQRKQKEIAGICPVPERSRALIKVQDGCDQHCSYCVVSFCRGRPVSLPIAEVALQFDQLIAQGFQEVVLTGLNLGKYQEGKKRLVDLLDTLLKRPGRFRIRLASIEPDEIDDELIAIIADPRICAHFHIPLQSGDDRLLQAMGRNYTTGQYRKLIEKLLKEKPDANIGADIIVGFPGEDDNSFQVTRRFLEDLPLSYLHVFPYSPRPNTLAARWGDPVPRAVKKARVSQLRLFSQERRRAYQRRFVGTVREAILEPKDRALTDNYLRISVMNGIGKTTDSRQSPVLGPKGELVKLRIELRDEELIGWKI
ncbi:MAG: MiaB/RimO family radical SAM methylthiotransferase [candidate division WOR-3 bacterium]